MNKNVLKHKPGGRRANSANGRKRPDKPSFGDNAGMLEKESIFLESILKPDELAACSRARDLPFAEDREYYASLQKVFFLRSVLLKMDEALQQVLIDPRTPAVADESGLKERIEAVILDLETVHSSRIGASRAAGKLPRVLRLQDRLGLAADELLALSLCLVFSSEPNSLVNHYAGHIELDELNLILGISSSRASAIAAADGTLVREGLLIVEEHYSHVFIKRTLRVNQDVLEALLGFPISRDSYFKIASTPLGEILKAEPGFPFADCESAGIGDDRKESGKAAPGPGAIDDAPLAPGDESELEFYKFLNSQVDAGEAPRQPAECSGGFRPYADDLEYLQDHFAWLAAKIKLKRMALDECGPPDPFEKGAKPGERRELISRENLLANRCAHRLRLTGRNGRWLPRLEKLVRLQRLDEFERNLLLLLIGLNVSPDFIRNAGFSSTRAPNVIDATFLLSRDLREQISARKYFYKSSRLVRDTLIKLDTTYRALEDVNIEIDRRMMDFCLGLEMEIGEIVDGGHLYLPRTRMEQVVLPREQKDQVVRTVLHHAQVRKASRDLGFDEVMPYGRGQVLLFYGPSGSGKTMTANAIANMLRKKLLLVNYPSLGGVRADENIRYIFREARIHDAIVFFDECDGIFASRDQFNSDVYVLLTEIERHSGMIIMATNRPQVLDEAMKRRVTLAIPFHNPDCLMRERIWDVHLPEKVGRGDDVDLAELAFRFDLNGGLIKNAVLNALSEAVSRGGKDIVITQADLLQGARLQLTGYLTQSDFEHRVVPRGGLENIVSDRETFARLRDIVHSERAGEKLFGQWGFGEGSNGYGTGTAVLLHGDSGTGKTFAAEAIAFELGRPLKVVSADTVLSKWVGDTARHIASLFSEAQKNDSILLFDEADALFAGRTRVGDATDRYANADVNLLLQKLERHKGMVILTTNLRENLDHSLFRRFKYIVGIKRPDADVRARLWRALLPAKAPLAPDADLQALAARFDLTGGQIKNAVFRAASRAALRPGDASRILQDDLINAAEEEAGKPTGKPIGFK